MLMTMPSSLIKLDQLNTPRVTTGTSSTWNSHKAYDSGHFDYSEDKFGLAIALHTAEVDADNDGEEYCNENGLIESRVPVRYRDRCSYYLQR